MLALAFLIVVGTVLIADALGFHIPKGYVYFAMGFSLLVEALNIRLRTGQKKSPSVEGTDEQQIGSRGQ